MADFIALREKVRLKIRKKLISILKISRNKQLLSKDFTIISNNCWGGQVYESLDLPKLSPTVGMFFMAEEYISFLKQFPNILYEEIKFIQPKESKYAEYLSMDSRFGSYPIGVIGNVEIEFLHYHSQQEVIEKWKRRVSRINYNNIIFKMNDQNLCVDRHIKEFLDMGFTNKIFFSSRKIIGKNIISIKSKSSHGIMSSEEPIIFTRKFNVIKYINSIKKGI